MAEQQSFVGTDLVGARFVDSDLSGAHFREAVMSGVTMAGVVLTDVVIDGLVQNLSVNGVEVMTYVSAELDRRHPVRPLLRSNDPPDLREGWRRLVDAWTATTGRIEALPAGQEHTRVDDEWSAVETLRHLVFVVDSWFDHAVRGAPDAFHPLGLAAGFIPHQTEMGLDPTAEPTLTEVLAVRADQQTRLADYLATVTPAALARPGAGRDEHAWPPDPAAHTVLDCLHVVLEEEWAHHQFCVRDLDLLTAASTSEQNPSS